MMMANIELKSDEFGTDNYAVVFTRAKQEKFYEQSELHKSSLSSVRILESSHLVFRMIDPSTEIRNKFSQF
jgi:hypothetical protein